MVLQVARHPAGAELPAALRVTYRLGAGTAELSTEPREVEEQALCFELVEEGSPAALLSAPVAVDPADLLLRCDRVDFPPGAVADLHTHAGPGLRVLLRGSIRVETLGAVSGYGPLEAWYERGPDPVLATADAAEPSAFVRCLLLPRALRGRPSITYVHSEDAGRPRRQSYTVFVDEPVELPVAR